MSSSAEQRRACKVTTAGFPQAFFFSFCAHIGKNKHNQLDCNYTIVAIHILTRENGAFVDVNQCIEIRQAAFGCRGHRTGTSKHLIATNNPEPPARESLQFGEEVCKNPERTPQGEHFPTTRPSLNSESNTGLQLSLSLSRSSSLFVPALSQL